ncbi:MAG TPA: PHP domain-containing protein [Arthrobacter sp.]
MGTFVHLNGHSEHSTDGYSRIPELVAAAKANGQTALALTDTNLSGALEFRRETERHGIKPIIGLDVRLIDGSFDNPLRATFHDLTLLAETRAGWRSLVALYNDSRAKEIRNGAYVDYDMLARHHVGLFALTGGRGGSVDVPLDRRDVDAARANLAKLERAVGVGRVFLEASDSASAQLLTGVFSDRHVLATGRYRQAHEADTAGRQAMLLLRSGRTHANPRADWVKSDADMRAADPKRDAWQNAVSFTSAVADAIDADVIPGPEHQVPAATVPAGFTNAGDYLRHLAFRGLADRFDEIPYKAIERLNLELERIVSISGAADHVLAAHDLISWCRTEGVLTAPRGTSSGSMVLFCLGMTEHDPLRYGLKFDRFMRAGRNDLPRLDFDFQLTRRQEVYDYLAARWPDQVARASAFIQAKAETARRRCGIDEQTAAQVDGRVQQPTVSVCAVLIAPAALHGTIPFRIDQRPGHENDLPTAAWDAHALEDQGYLVLNLLFTPTLDVINRTAEAVRATPEGDVHVATLLPDGDGDLYWDSTDAAWDLIASGDTDGVFQLTTDDANAAAAAARPRNLTDMAALIAVGGRPERLDAYLYARSLRTTRYGRYDALTADESEQMWLSGALSETCGQLVFQEQVMDLFTAVGGFSDARAELAWRTLAKKSPDVAYIREKFMEGAVQEQYDRAGDRYSIAFSEETAERVFDLLVNAAPGTFSAAHAYSYARLAFQTAWLRAHFPETFVRILDEARPMRRRRTKV